MPPVVIEAAPAAPSIGHLACFSTHLADADAASGVGERSVRDWSLVEAPSGFLLGDARLVRVIP